jgi:hypothetical protein
VIAKLKFWPWAALTSACEMGVRGGAFQARQEAERWRGGNQL